MAQNSLKSVEALISSSGKRNNAIGSISSSDLGIVERVRRVKMLWQSGDHLTLGTKLGRTFQMVVMPSAYEAEKYNVPFWTKDSAWGAAKEFMATGLDLAGMMRYSSLTNYFSAPDYGEYANSLRSSITLEQSAGAGLVEKTAFFASLLPIGASRNATMVGSRSTVAAKGVTNSSLSLKPYSGNLLEPNFVGPLRPGIDRAFTVGDFPEIASKISQKQLRHIAGRPEYRGGGFLDNVEDAQAILDAYHSGAAQIIGQAKNGFPVVKVNNITATNVNLGAGIKNQPTSVFMIKGSASPSIVPLNPNWKPL